jgi:hypothetical protein
MELEHKRIWVKGLLIECTMRKVLDDCPAKELRKLPIEERLKIADEMKADQIEFIITCHKECLRRRDETYIN